MGIKISKDFSKLLPIIAISFILIIITVLVFRATPFSGDEYSYLFQSQISANGRLSAPVPEKQEFFYLHHTVMRNGKWYTKYPIAWPLILSIGTLSGFPWIINPIFGILTIVIAFYFVSSAYDRKTAIVAALFLAFSPFFIFNSASFFPHPSELFFAVLSVLLFQKSMTSKSPRLLSLSGISLGILFLIRPFSGVILGIPLFTYGLALTKRKSIRTGNFLMFTLLCLLVSGLFLYSNLIYTGDPLLSSYALSGSANDYSLSFDLLTGMRSTSYRLQLLFFWLPAIFVFIPFSFLEKNEWNYILLFIIILNLSAYLFFMPTGSDQFGPRYYYISLAPLIALSANGLRAFLKKSDKLKYVLLIIIGINLILCGAHAIDMHQEVIFRNQVYDFAGDNSISNAIIFMKSSEQEGCSFYTRNPPFLDSDVLYVCDLGERNSELTGLYPDKKHYYFDLADMGRSPSQYRENLVYVPG